MSSKGQSGFASNLVGCDAVGKLHWKLLSSKCEGEGLGLGDADDTREEDGGAPIVGVNRPQFEDMWLDVNHDVLGAVACSVLLSG